MASLCVLNRLLARAALFLLAVVGVVLPLAGQPHSPWRYFTSLDGMSESWVTQVTIGPSGRLFITHGDVKTFSVYDGYTFQQFPAPGTSVVVREGPTGQLWSLTEDHEGLQVFEGGGWKAQRLRAPAGAGRPLHAGFLPWATDRVLVIGPDRAMAFDRRRGTVSVLKTAPESGIGGFTAFTAGRAGDAGWVGGSVGVARIGQSADGGVRWTPTRFPAELGLEDCREIVEGAGGEIFVTAVQRGRERLVRFDGRAWTPLDGATVPGTGVLGWPGTDGAIWLAEHGRHGFDLSTRHPGGARQPVARERGLSGRLNGVVVDGRGGFWLATSLGLAHYAPPTWRTPPELAGEERHASSILETASGELYALADRTLLRRVDRWRTYGLPAGADPALHRTRALVELPDGRIAIGSGHGLVTFDPKHNTFGLVKRPDGGGVHVLGPRRQGGAWVLTNPDDRHFRLEIFDGSTFRTLYDAGDRWTTIGPRAVLEATDGNVYIVPDQLGIGVLRDGAFRHIGAEEGYPGSSLFTAAEVAPGRIWFGGRDEVVEYDGRSWKVVRKGLQAVRSIAKGRDGGIWVGSGTGIHVFRNRTWLTMASPEGLPDGAVFGVLEDRSGRIWAATTAGLGASCFEADREAPETMIQASLNPWEAPPDGIARIVFEGVDRWSQTRADRLLFSWRADSGAWSEYSGARSAELTGLAAGRRHRFEVRAMDRNGNVDPHPTLYDFKVLLPWYREAGFLAMSLFALAGIAAAVVLFTTRHRRLGSQLETAHHQLEQIAATAPGIIYTFRIGADGRVTFPYTSPSVTGLYGSLTPEQLAQDGSAVFALMAASDRANVEESIAESARTMTPWRAEYRVNHPERGEIWVEGYSTPERQLDGGTLWHGFVTEITERKRMEAEIRMKSDALENSLSAFFVVAADGTIEYANRTYLQLWGYESAAEVAGTRFADHCADAATIIAQTQRDGQCTIEIPVRRRGGPTSVALMSVQRSADEQGRQIFIGTAVDISERKRSEEALRESRTRLQLAMDAAELGLCDVDVSGEHLNASPRWREMFEFDSDPAVDEVIARIHPEDRAGLVKAYADVVMWGKTAALGYRIVPPSGRIRWIDSHAAIHKSSSGVRVLTVVRDITGQKDAEQALREREQQLQSILDYVPVSVWTARRDGTIEYWNTRAKEAMGSHRFILHPDDAAEHQANWQGCLEAGGPHSTESRFLMKDNQYRWLLSQAVPQRDSAGNITRWFGTATDIHDRKLAEYEALRLNIELEGRVRDRTVQLEAANRELEAFAYSVSHDLRAPLRGIDGWSLALLEDYRHTLDEKGRQYLGRVRSEAQRMGLLIDDLLQLSQITRGELNRETVDLSRLADGIAGRLQESYPERSIHFSVQPGLTAPGDERLMGVALTNLLSNAVKFTGPRKEAWIEFGNMAVDGERAFYVRDNGVGFNMDYAGMLFGAFQRLHKTAEFPGSGVGLATVQRVIRKHGGRVWADSRSGEGASFYFTIPETE